MELMRLYINQGRFGEFVTEILYMDFKRKQEEAEKEEDNKLWLAYIHSMSDKSFNEWKAELRNNSINQQRKEPVNLAMTDKQVANVKQQARGILKNFSPV